MANIIDYIKWRGDLTFEQDAFNEIDALILSQISYLNFDGLIPFNDFEKDITLSHLCFEFATSENYVQRSDTGLLINKDTIELFYYAGNSFRFRDIKILGYVSVINNDKEEQFSAVTYNIANKFYFVAYRGTDDTIVGWKEDFNLAIKDVVPAQIDAVNYLNNVANKTKGTLLLGGHSKGGNLAIYAAAKVSNKINKRIERIYNYDGPGFSSDRINSPEFTSIIPKIKSYYPHFSIIGMMFYRAGTYSVVESDETGIMQHDALSWHLLGKNFALVDEFNSASDFLSNTINSCINELSQNQIELLIETVFELIKATNAKTNSELEDNLFKNSKKIISAVTKLDSETKKAVETIMKQILKIVKNRLPHYESYLVLTKKYLEARKPKRV